MDLYFAVSGEQGGVVLEIEWLLAILPKRETPSGIEELS